MDNSKPGKAYLAEALGTFLLVFSIVAAVTLYVGALAGSQSPLPGITIPLVAFAHGFALFLGIQTLGAISGGHFNPAVTIGLLSIKQISVPNAIGYIIAQVVGALGATLFLALVLHDQAQIVNFGQASLADGISTGAGIGLEALMVFVLVWTITATAVNPEGTKEWAPLAISTALAIGVLLIGQWTGAALNPARALAPDITNAIFGKSGSGGFGSVGDFFLVYLIAPVAAGVLAATTYNALFIKGDVGASPAPSEESPF
jgi:MIP family channel proteins